MAAGSGGQAGGAGRTALAASLAVLGAAHLLRHRRGPAVTVPVSLTAAALLAGIGRRAGLSWAELGMDGASLRRGLREGAVAAGSVGAVYAAGALIPATRPLFADRRAAPGLGSVLRQAAVEVPLGTVVLEETAFRAVLPALLRRTHGEPAARAVPVLLFGLWHVLPSAELAESNPALAATRFRAAAGSVVVTAAGGAVFAALHRRSGSVLAPALLHTAFNSLGYLAAWAVRAGQLRAPRAGRGRRPAAPHPNQRPE